LKKVKRIKELCNIFWILACFFLNACGKPHVVLIDENLSQYQYAETKTPWYSKSQIAGSVKIEFEKVKEKYGHGIASFALDTQNLKMTMQNIIKARKTFTKIIEADKVSSDFVLIVKIVEIAPKATLKYGAYDIVVEAQLFDKDGKRIKDYFEKKKAVCQYFLDTDTIKNILPLIFITICERIEQDYSEGKISPLGSVIVIF